MRRKVSSLESGAVRRFVSVAAVFVLAGVAAHFAGSGEGWERFLGWVDANRLWGALVIVLATTAGALLGLSCLPLTLGCGFLFGAAKGLPVMMAGTALGTAAAFLVGRSVARKRVERKFAGRPRLLALREAVGQRGLWIVFLSRLSPFSPYNILTYVFSLTRVSFRSFFAGSVLGNLPVTALYVYAGSLTKSLAGAAAGKMVGGGVSPAFAVVAGGLTMVAALFLGWIARKEVGALTGKPSLSTIEGQKTALHR